MWPYVGEIPEAVVFEIELQWKKPDIRTDIAKLTVAPSKCHKYDFSEGKTQRQLYSNYKFRRKLYHNLEKCILLGYLLVYVE